MSNVKKIGDLEVNQDLDFQRKELTFENWGWIAMVVVAIVALLGLFGDGLLSNASARNDALQVDYGRFERILAPAEIQVQVDYQQAKDGEIRIHFDRSLLSPYKIELITPEPSGTELSSEEITYIFTVGESNKPLKVIFILTGSQVGRASGEISVGDSLPVKISQFIYP